MDETAENVDRVFKTGWFTKAAKKSHITDDELCSAIRQVMLGQADDLGGGVYKKRLSRNLYRSIIIVSGRRYWVYAYLFGKQDRANINSAELAAFRMQASVYALKTTVDIARDVRSGELTEICYEKEVQERCV